MRLLGSGVGGPGALRGLGAGVGGLPTSRIATTLLVALPGRHDEFLRQKTLVGRTLSRGALGREAGGRAGDPEATGGLTYCGTHSLPLQIIFWLGVEGHWESSTHGLRTTFSVHCAMWLPESGSWKGSQKAG